jgi:hypothetical protein
MLMAFPNATPTEASSYYVDMLVTELIEPDDAGDPPCLPALAAAARECWQTLPAPPSIAEFMKAARNHQGRIENVFRDLCDVLEASNWAEDVIEASSKRQRSERHRAPTARGPCSVLWEAGIAQSHALLGSNFLVSNRKEETCPYQLRR